jgi:hypothetical protein
MKVRLLKISKDNYVLQVKNLFGWKTMKDNNETNWNVSFTSKKDLDKYLAKKYPGKDVTIYPTVKIKKAVV